ncbi:MAG: fused MFS/spermidine synthase [Chloroflexaceae bacterium]|nr:fused MFS/spermidine synthase [Chloroflexaceae bacterium]
MLPHASRSDPFLLTVVFLAGVGTLGIEMVMPRLLAPFFGTSQPIWAVVIGMTLLYLAIGYWLGGRLADRNPDERTLYKLIAWAGLICGFIPLVAQPILRFAQQSLIQIAAGGFIAALVAVVLLFAAPVILMATVGPFAIRLQLLRMQEGVAAAGRTAGTISALSTIGSILGTFLTVLLLIPSIGTDRTLLLFAVFLTTLGIIGLRDWRYLLLLAAVAALALWNQFGDQGIKGADCFRCTLVAEAESSSNYIQVARQEFQYADGTLDPRMVLLLNEGRARHSVYRLRYRDTGDSVDLLTDGGPWDYFSVAPYFYPNRDPSSVRSMAMIGSAAGTVPQQFLAIYGPDTRIDAVEIDQRIIELGRRYFDMRDGSPQFPNYRVHAEDGRYWLAGATEKYDVIGMDAYHQPYIPFHLTTVEFFREVKARLNEDGVAVVNAGRPPSGDDSLVNALASTMVQVFPQVFIMDTRGQSNGIIVGVNRPVGDGVTNFLENADRMQVPALQIVMQWALYEGQGPVREFTPDQALSRPFTDDLAPVERLVDGMIFSEAGRLR